MVDIVHLHMDISNIHRATASNHGWCMLGYWWQIVADLMSLGLAVRSSDIDNWKKKHVLKNDWPVGQRISLHTLKWIRDEAYVQGPINHFGYVPMFTQCTTLKER